MMVELPPQGPQFQSVEENTAELLLTAGLESTPSLECSPEPKELDELSADS